MNAPTADKDLMSTLPPVPRAVVLALGFDRAKEFLLEYGGVNVNIPKHRSDILGLSECELQRLRDTLINHMDAGGRIWLPKADKLLTWARNIQIRKDRHSTSINELARHHRLSSRQILNICRENF